MLVPRQALYFKFEPAEENMKVKKIAVAMGALLVSSCSISPPPVLSAEDMARECKKQESMNYWTEECLTWKHQRDAELAAKRKADDDDRKAYLKSQQEQQVKQKQEDELREEQAIRSDEKNGYRHITFEDFNLDSFKLKGSNLTVSQT